MKTYEARIESVKNKARKLKNCNRLIALGCTGAAVAAVLLVLFVPYNTQPPSVIRYSGSPYYSIIQELNALKYQPPKYKNNFEALFQKLNPSPMAPADGPLATQAVVNSEGVMNNQGAAEVYPMPDSNNGSYVEVTDNQVAGVIEGDIFKRTDRYIFYLRDRMLYVYSIEGAESQQIAAYSTWTQELSGQFSSQKGKEMFLSQDGNTVTILYSVMDHEKESYTAVMNYDVSDPKNIRHTGKLLMKGSYNSSRMKDGRLLLTGSYRVKNADYSKPESFLPAYGWLENMQCFAPEDVQTPQDIGTSVFQTYCLVDAATLQMLGSKALLDYSSIIYVSENNIYATRYYHIGDQEAKKYVSDITAIGYSENGLETKGTVTVDGQILNQYSMDEYKGSFRVVTSTYEVRPNNMARRHDSADLYCFDTATWKLQGMVQGFAPKGDEVTSVRWEGECAYVCTAMKIQVTDPVYFFDLSDPKNISYTDTGIINGYSTSLINFSDGDLLGIGYNEFRGLKVEVYREEGDKVVSVCSYELDCDFSEEYKSYLIDRENGLVGLAVRIGGETEYLLLHYDGQELRITSKEAFNCLNLDNVRADYIDGWLYILSAKLQVVKPEM